MSVSLNNMEELLWSAMNNSSEVTPSLSSTFNSTTALTTALLSPARLTVSVQTVAAVGLVVCGIGSFANALVLAVLVRARRQFGSSAHTLIVNQSVADLTACVFAVIL